MVQTYESSLLLTLDEISQLISHSRNAQETMLRVVQSLQRRFGTEVCSVYLLEPGSGELVLAETVGLHREAVGRIRMPLHEGLVGLTAQEAKPVKVANAFRHPRFKFFPEAGEEPYHSFLGTPLFESGHVAGVLVLQTKAERDYSDDETRMLNTAAAQLMPLLHEAWGLKFGVEDTGAKPLWPGREPEKAPLAGLSLSPGVGVGVAYWARRFDWGLLTSAAVDRDGERQRLTAAMEAARAEIERLSHRLAELLGEEPGAILQAQLLILQDSRVEEDLAGFLAEGASAESAVLRAVQKYTRTFEQLSDPLFRERLHDIRDVLRRIIWHLRPETSGPEIQSPRLVLVGEEASVADLFSVDLDRLAAVVVEQGGKTSHAAILARSLGIPMVAQIGNLTVAVRTGIRLLVDGDRAQVVVQPSDEQLRTRQAQQAATVAVREAPPVAAVASAGPARRGPAVEANVNLLGEVRVALEQGAVGVGLYRSEFLVVLHRIMLGEEQQVRNYRQLLKLLGGRPASIRTFDLRADKSPQPSAGQPSPGSLDWRLVLRSAAVQRVFREQARAILRAAVDGPARILVPLVVSTEQLQWVQATLAEVRDELRRDGLPFGEHVPLGIMIEVPAAAFLVEEWAPHVDFLCLGTNDLMASSMGVSRDDPVAEAICNPLHPGLLRTVQLVIASGHAAGKPVTVCGELAATEQGVPLLADLGADALSVPADRIAQVQAWLNAWSATRPAA